MVLSTARNVSGSIAYRQEVSGDDIFNFQFPEMKFIAMEWISSCNLACLLTFQINVAWMCRASAVAYMIDGSVRL